MTNTEALKPVIMGLMDSMGMLKFEEIMLNLPDGTARGAVKRAVYELLCARKLATDNKHFWPTDQLPARAV